MKQQFFQIQLKQSSQQPSCITLENWVDQLTNPNFRQNLKQCDEQQEMMNIFPIVGYGLQLKTKKNLNDIKIKVLSISQVEKIIDLSTFNQLSRDKPNCILPLLKKQEQNHDLLRCELFQRKISQLITENDQIFIENSYLHLIQSTLKYLITIYEKSIWQKEIMEEILEVCEQVLFDTKLHINQIQNEEFQNSQFKLLNVFCLFQQNKIDQEEIYNKFLLPKILKKTQYDLNDQMQNGLGAFFDCLNLREDQFSFENIKEDIEKYIEENNYFYLKIFYGKYLSKLIEYFLCKEQINDKLKQKMFFKLKENQKEIKQLISSGLICQQEVNKIQESKTLIVNFTQSTIHKYLLNRLIKEEYNFEHTSKYFKSLNEAIQTDNYYAHLLRHAKYDDLIQFYNIYNLLNEQKCSYDNGLNQFCLYIERKLIRQISIQQLRKKDYKSFQEVRQSQDIQEKSDTIMIYSKLFGINGQDETKIQQIILDRISEICWINYTTYKTNFQVDEEVINFIQMVKDFPQNNFDLDIYSEYLSDVAKFCYKMKSLTQTFKYFDKFEKNVYQNLLPKDPFKANIFKKIFQLTKRIKENQFNF
ncbi:unnamed protein product [Paramecium sonneborni]|uniref:Uncharacterized protein n=1 Tax=Paramecium sonneborni TaxID=65129 RepID=A0A8S1KJR6_9CILI|nr:unnamed protein product [Paramecium sonneborni]